MQSIHGQGFTRGNSLAPVCTDCHGIHTIKAHVRSELLGLRPEPSRDGLRPLSPGRRLSQEYGVPANRMTTYLDSYHGLAAQVVRWW